MFEDFLFSLFLSPKTSVSSTCLLVESFFEATVTFTSKFIFVNLLKPLVSIFHWDQVYFYQHLQSFFFLRFCLFEPNVSTFLTNSSYDFFSITSMFITSLSLLKPTGEVSNLSTSDFEPTKPNFLAYSDSLMSVAHFKSNFVA